MRRLIVDEKVEVWRRTEYDVDDKVTDAEFIDKLRELSKTGEAFEIEDVKGVTYQGGEYLEDTEAAYSGYGAHMEVFDDDFNSLDSW